MVIESQTDDAVHSFGSTMTGMQQNALLNQIVVDLGCSLLQFVGEVSPWTPIGAVAARETLAKLVAKQRQHVDRLVDLLVDRRWPVDFGIYPAEFTDLHFLSLKSLLPRVIASQATLVSELSDLAVRSRDDAEAAAAMVDILAGERVLTEELKSLKL